MRVPRVTASERLRTRERLVDAGTREFADRGLAGARFDEIAVAAGHGKGTIYNYFSGKESLFVAVVQRWCETLLQAVTSTTVSGRAALWEVAEADVAIAQENPDLARVVIQQMPALVGPHRAACDQAIEPGLAFVSGVIADAVARREFVTDLPAREVARLWLASLSVLELEALDPESALELDQVVALVDRHFTGGLCP